jgi:hypothetical protein
VTVTCFWLQPEDRAKAGLRRYAPASQAGSCPLPDGYHNALASLREVPVIWQAGRPERARHWVTDGYGPDSRYGVADCAWPPHGDPRWPAACGCGYEFGDGDPHQEWFEPLYRRGDTGALVTLRDAPDGAMWDAAWLPPAWRGPDGRSLVVKCPGGGEWTIDGRASNCAMPADTEHRCWVRHGDPPAITVGKDGLTCAAGGGSIQVGDYHGFLRDGAFT